LELEEFSRLAGLKLKLSCINSSYIILNIQLNRKQRSYTTILRELDTNVLRIMWYFDVHL